MSANQRQREGTRTPKVVGRATAAQILGAFGAAVRPPAPGQPPRRDDGRRLIDRSNAELFVASSAVGIDGY